MRPRDLQRCDPLPYPSALPLPARYRDSSSPSSLSDSCHSGPQVPQARGVAIAGGATSWVVAPTGRKWDE